MLLYIFFVMTDLIPLYMQKRMGFFWSWLSMMLISFVVIALVMLNVKVPGPSPLIKRVVIAIFGLKTQQ